MVTITINNIEVHTAGGTSLLDAAQQAGIYIPRLCSHPDLPPVTSLKAAGAVFRNGVRIENQRPDLNYEGCGLCAVSIAGQTGLLHACAAPVAEGMIVRTDTPEVRAYRQDRLALILTKHPHACLTCAQREGCARFPCSMDVPEKERCCSLFGNCELQTLVEYVGIKPDTPRFIFENIPVNRDEPLIEIDYNLCIGCSRCLRACRDLRGIGALDFVFGSDGRMLVGNTGKTLAESACKFCTACVGVCPTGALMDKNEFHAPPCQTACPAGIDVPQYVYLCGEGKFSEAAAILHETVPFPRTLGYICHRPCEAVCRRKELNQPISIRALKRTAAENDDRRWKSNLKPVTQTGKKAAVIGSGPAGLTAAYYLARLGHSVTVFEAASRPGGMMQTAIPRFRLPQEVIDEEICEILSAGIELKLNSRITDISSLLKIHDAVLLAVGMAESEKLPIPGNDLPNVLTALDFLKSVSEGSPTPPGKNVVVLGGGGTACDAARVARRLGAPEVTIVYRRSETEMPADPEEVRQAREEGVLFKFLASPAAIRASSQGRAAALECIGMELGEPDSSGRRRVQPKPDSRFTLQADAIIFATGQGLDAHFTQENRLSLAPSGVLQTKETTLETNLKSVFACGDAVSGPSSVVEAIASGRKAASAVDKYLGGSGDLTEKLTVERESPAYMGRKESFANRSRAAAALLPSTERVFSHKCVETALSAEQALTEGSRCLRCDSRFNISNPTLPPRRELWSPFTSENVERAPESEGVYQLLDEQENVIFIKGALNLRQELKSSLASHAKARFFLWETDPFYTKRESQLLQQYVARHGQMPEDNRELDDLF